MVVAIGAIGIYMCMVGVSSKKFPFEEVDKLVIHDLRREDNSCHRHVTSVDFFQHYPQPFTYDRFALTPLQCFALKCRSAVNPSYLDIGFWLYYCSDSAQTWLSDSALQFYISVDLVCRQECGCTPVHYFVILSMQRSGSGWFETLVNNHPNISSHGEIFSVKPRRQNFSTIARTLDTIYNLDWQSSAAKNECTAAVGFKWMLNQVHQILCYVMCCINIQTLYLKRMPLNKLS